MKRNIYSILVWSSLVLMAVSASAAEEVTDIPTAWSNELQTSTQSVIQAGLEKDDGVLMTRAMIRAQFEERSIVKAQHIVAKTLKNDLPVEPVMNKAYEGIAKGIPAESVVQAMERVRSRYEHAYGLADQLSKKKEVVGQLGNAFASGSAAGLSREDAEQIVSRLQVRAREMEQSQLEDLATECMLTARDMVRQGVLSETATDVVNQALDKDFNVQEMQSLRSSFMSQSALGSGESLAKNYSDAIQNGNGSLDNRGNSFGGNTDAGNADSGGSDGGGNNGSAGDSGSGGDSSGGNSDGGNGGSGGSGGSGGNGGSNGGSGR